MFQPGGVPVVGFASAGDSFFSRPSSVARPTHALPRDFLPGAAMSRLKPMN
ncbi:hypothetical protein [Desulfospira joergensenii]|uniref:hypothetical protein n=1 Tax=Desulfospira joergensenii TaxID=53329 RepID=UPI0012947CD3|nr:hypothetical protein [Desulfospira joergensenii]